MLPFSQFLPRVMRFFKRMNNSTTILCRQSSRQRVKVVPFRNKLIKKLFQKEGKHVFRKLIIKKYTTLFRSNSQRILDREIRLRKFSFFFWENKIVYFIRKKHTEKDDCFTFPNYLHTYIYISYYVYTSCIIF